MPLVSIILFECSFQTSVHLTKCDEITSLDNDFRIHVLRINDMNIYMPMDSGRKSQQSYFLYFLL